jgi:hypothetical protein
LASINRHYDELLAELKQKGGRLANEYIIRLYSTLREEENLPPEDCRAKIEHDCLDLWSKATIRKYLPPEAKDFKKQAAGKTGSENKKNKKKALLLVAHSQNDARTNLAENDSVSQNEEETTTSFHNEVEQELSSRTIFPELLEANKIIADKDSTIERLTKENEELLKQHNPTSQGQSIAIQQDLKSRSDLAKKDALIAELKLQIDRLEEQKLEATKGNNNRNEKIAFPSTSNDQYENATIDFELSFPFEEVRNHMACK